MPYKRNYRKRNYRRKRGGNTAWYNKKYSVAQIAKSAWKGVKYVKGLVNSEMYSYEAAAGGTVTTAGVVVPITLIAQGDGESARTGNSILAKSLLLRLTLVMDKTHDVQTTRILVIRDTQQVGDTYPTLTELLQAPTNVLSPLNDTTKGRFDVLMDRYYMESNTGTQGHHCEKFFRFNSHVRWNGVANTDIQKNGLYLMLVSDAATGGENYNYYFRLNYHDN